MTTPMLHSAPNNQEKRKVSEANENAFFTKQYSRVDFQVSILTGLIVIISCYLIFFLNYHSSYQSMIGELQDRALGIHDYLDGLIDERTFHDLSNRDEEKTELYADAKKVLERVKSAAGVRYLYTAKRGEDGKFIYLVDGLSEDNEDFRHIGDLIEPECIPDMERAYKGKTILPGKINETTWGAIFISYFPMHEGDEVVGVLGIEFDARRQFESFKRMSIVTPIVIVLFCLIAAAVAVRWFRRISNPSYQDMASTDFLTGLKNRNAFEVDLHNFDGLPDKDHFALVSIDLDNLKMVNDTCGHAAGDRYIQMCSNIIRECVGDNGILYRIGGDEFSVIIKKCTEDYLKTLEEEIWKRVEMEEGQEFHIGMSIGYALYDSFQDGSSLFGTLKRADAKMYACKKDRKNRERNMQ